MKRKVKILTAVLLALYLALLVWIVLFRLQFDLSSQETVRGVNLIPFSGGAEGLKGLLLFVPLGVYLQLLLPEKKPVFLLAILAGTSLVLELSQYALSAGLTDVTDLLCSAAGGLLGILLYRTAERIMGNPEKTERLVLTVSVVLTTLVIDFLALLLFAGR